MASSKTAEIAQLNDQFSRGDPSVPGQRFVTAGVVHLISQLDIPAETLIQRVAQFDDFNDDNDPHGERDFGAFEFHRHQLFWKSRSSTSAHLSEAISPTRIHAYWDSMSINLLREPFCMLVQMAIARLSSSEDNTFACFIGSPPIHCNITFFAHRAC